jgi:hypothetical protein
VIGPVGEGQEFELAEPEPEVADSSLRSRMQQRSEQLEKVTTERFPVPGYDDLLEVELRVTGMRQATRIAQRNERQRDPGTKNLYVMCDLLLGATVQFWRSGADQPLKETWTDFAQMVDGCPDNVTPRQAMIFLLKEHRVPWLYTSWEEWMRSSRPEVEEELTRDFTPTG